MNNTYLQHHGILGQKWGVRRFQNPDGTWTEAGKERYGDISKMSAKEYQNLGIEKRTSIAQEHGVKAMQQYEEIDDKYGELIIEALMNNDQDEVFRLYDEYQKEVNDKVTKPLYDAGYDWVYHGGGTDVLTLQFGKELENSEQTRWGERYVDDFIIDNGDMKIYETEIGKKSESVNSNQKSKKTSGIIQDVDHKTQKPNYKNDDGTFTKDGKDRIIQDMSQEDKKVISDKFDAYNTALSRYLKDRDNEQYEDEWVSTYKDYKAECKRIAKDLIKQHKDLNGSKYLDSSMSDIADGIDSILILDLLK